MILYTNVNLIENYVIVPYSITSNYLIYRRVTPGTLYRYKTAAGAGMYLYITPSLE